MKYIHFLIPGLVIFLVSCTAEKRLYRPGFYVDRGDRQDRNAIIVSKPSPEIRTGQTHLAVLSANENCSEEKHSQPHDSARTFKKNESASFMRITKQRPEIAKDSLSRETKRFTPEKKAGTSAILSLIFLLGLFIPSPLALVFVGLALLFAILALIYGIRARKDAKAAGRPVPKNTKQAIVVGAIVSGIIVIGALLILVLIKMVQDGRINVLD